MKLIGRGDDAKVLEWAPDQVCRVGKCGDEYDNYIRFIEALDSPHAPVVFSHSICEGASVTTLERLRHIEEREGALWERVNAFAALTYSIVDERPHALSGRDLECLASFGEFGVALAHECKRLGYQMDVSRNNVMVRPATGELVVTDPWGAWRQ